MYELFLLLFGSLEKNHSQSCNIVYSYGVFSHNVVPAAFHIYLTGLEGNIEASRHEKKYKENKQISSLLYTTQLYYILLCTTL